MKKLSLLIALTLIATSTYAAEIVYDETTENLAVTTKTGVEAVYVNDAQIVVHEEEIKSIGDEVLKRSRSNTITINASDTFTHPVSGEETNTYGYIVTFIEESVGAGNGLFDSVEAAINAYKALPEEEVEDVVE